MQDLAGIIKRLRLELGLSQREAARRLGISPTRLSDYERGKAHGTQFPAVPPRDRLVRMAEVYNFPLDTLLGLAGYPPVEAAPVPKPTAIEAQEREILHVFRALDDEKRELMYRVVKQFARRF